ncbi:MAG: ribosome small subunit-dependent GTPase A [Gemmatimonadaceae bacterium]|nr:ribosome small subunit-dependent GTPase A [Gemmatimonadaceae bacterium]
MSDRDGIVLHGTGGVWRVRLADGEECDATLAGRLKQDDRGGVKLAVGDRVALAEDDRGGWRIAEIAARTAVLSRREPGRRAGERVLAANVDQVIVVFAAAQPEPHVRMIDRFLVIAEGNDLRARLVLNKVDLVDPSALDTLAADYLAAGYPVHRTSIKNGVGLAALRAALNGRVSAFTGPSGVGKSSLLNVLLPGIDLRTQEISASVNKGRHTTVGARLIALPDSDGGYLVDTPGLREVGMWGLPSRELDHCFPEFASLLHDCRFADCAHEHEPDCAILAAVAAGTLSRARHESYLKLREELQVAERRY